MGIYAEKDKKGTKITPPDDDEEVDREYIPEHKSLYDAEEEDVRVVTKKAEQVDDKKAKNKKVTIPVKRPNTRSRATAPTKPTEKSPQQPTRELTPPLPPPPPLPEVTSPFFPLKVALPKNSII